MHEGFSSGEKRVCKTLVSRALAAGYRISVWDGGAWACKRSEDKATILDAVGNTGEDTLRFTLKGSVVGAGNIMLVWGNDPSGEELIADYTDCPEIAALVAMLDKEGM